MVQRENSCHGGVLEDLGPKGRILCEISIAIRSAWPKRGGVFIVLNIKHTLMLRKVSRITLATVKRSSVRISVLR